MISARPFEIALRVENRSKTRTGSSVLITRDGRAEVDARRPARNRRQNDFRRRNREVLAMVLAETDERQSDLIGETACSTTSAEHRSLRPRLPVSSFVTSPKVSSPSSI